MPDDQRSENHCATELLLNQYDNNHYTQCDATKLTKNKIIFMIKTCQKYHTTRGEVLRTKKRSNTFSVPIVRRTWATSALHIAFWSDLEDLFIPTTTLHDIENTERGHCAKTLGIMKRSIDMLEWNEAKWTIILDDDTLVSVERLLDLLRCYDSKTPIIIGERYGYGYTRDGEGGYDYPTGGSG